MPFSAVYAGISIVRDGRLFHTTRCTVVSTVRIPSIYKYHNGRIKTNDFDIPALILMNMYTIAVIYAYILMNMWVL